MYSVSKEMSLQSYQIVNPSENQTDFKAGQIVRFTIPRQIGFFDSHLSKLQMNCRTTGANYKMCFASTQCGVASMFDMVRISQNGRVISEITEYATLQHFIKTYENTLSTQQLDALSKGTCDYSSRAGTQAKAVSYNALMGQSINRSGETSMADAQQDVKFQLTLDFISLFEVLHAVPVMMMGDILIELRLAQTNQEIMKVLPSTSASHVCDAMVQGQAITLTPPFTEGFNNLADSPFVVGMSVQARPVAGNVGLQDYQITALAQNDTTGVITITTNPTVVANDVGATALAIVKGSDGQVQASATAEFVLSKAEMLLQVVKPPDQYVRDLASQVETEGLMVDMDTFTTYRATVLDAIKQQTITIPTTQSRAKAVFSVLRPGNQAPAFELDNSNDFEFEGKYGGLLDYRSQIDGEYYPNQPVDLRQFLGGFHFSQEHLRELEKAFDSAGIPFRSVDALKQNFVIGRALSSYGSSTNLTATPINLYLNYSGQGPAPAGAMDVVSYLHHTVRVAITPMGIEVMA